MSTKQKQALAVYFLIDGGRVRHLPGDRKAREIARGLLRLLALDGVAVKARGVA